MTNPRRVQCPPWPSLRIQTLAAECLIKIAKKRLDINMHASSALCIINDKGLVDAFRMISERASIRKLTDGVRLTDDEQKQLVVIDVVATIADDKIGGVDGGLAKEKSEAAIKEILQRRQDLRDEESIGEKLNSMMSDMEIASTRLRGTIRIVLNRYLSSKERIELLRIRDPERANLALSELNALYKSAIGKIRGLSISSDSN
jgi:hypothetical protein